MKLETLKRGNELQRKIEEIDNMLVCLASNERIIIASFNGATNVLGCSIQIDEFGEYEQIKKELQLMLQTEKKSLFTEFEGL